MPSARRVVAIAAVVVASLGAGGLLAACGDDSGSGGDVTLSPAGERGQQVAREQGCISCHTADGKRSTGPTWQDLAGSTVELEGGETVVADDDYLRESIVASRAKVVDGYANVMPVYEGELTEAELDDLIAYLHDLSSVDGPTEPDGPDASS